MLYAASFIVIASEITCLTMTWKALKLRMFQYYTILSNVAALLSTLAMLCVRLLGGDGRGFAAGFRFLSVCMMTMTLLVVVFVLTPMMKDVRKALYSGTQFFYHVFCPIVTLVSYVLWEPRSGAWYVPASVTAIYGAVVMYLNYLEKMDGPYPFVRVNHQSRAATVLWMLVMLGVIIGIAFGIMGLCWLAG